MKVIDNQCDAPDCRVRTYVMVGHCSNCGTTDLLVQHSTGHARSLAVCPTCEVAAVVSFRLATQEETASADVAQAPVSES